MSDESDIAEAGPKDAGPRAGQRLAEARKARDISIFDIAKELHLDEYKVQALEENRFDILGAPVFAKGHLRKYAELVGISVDDMMTDYAALNSTAGAPPVVGLPRKQVRDWQFGPWLLGALVVLVVSAIAYWWLGRVPEPESADLRPANSTMRLAPPAQDEPMETAEPAVPPVAEEPTAAPVSEPTPADNEAPAAAPAASETVAASPAAMSGSNAVSLSMTFTGDCWTEVSDATGARLFFDLGRDGRTLNVSGQAPLRVLFGNSDNVTVRVDGRNFPLTAAMRRGQTARLTINKR